MTKAEVIAAARRAGACEKALRWARRPEASWETIPPYWAYWLRTHCTLDAEAKLRAEEAACRSPESACYLRIQCRDLDADARWRVEEAACREPYWACHLRIECRDLNTEAKRRAEEAACCAPAWAYFLLTCCNDLDHAAKHMLEAAAIASPQWAYWLLAHRLISATTARPSALAPGAAGEPEVPSA